jgi:hypothetical protein
MAAAMHEYGRQLPRVTRNQEDKLTKAMYRMEPVLACP